MNQAKIGRFLQELRKDRGFTQEQLAAFMFACMPPVLRDAYRSLS